MLPRTISAVFGMAVFAVNFAEARQAKPTTDALSHAEPCASQTVGDIKSVVAAGKVVANQYSNEYFGLSVTADNGEIQAPVFVNAEAQRARLMDASALLKVHPFRYSMGVLVDSCAKNPLIHSLEQYVRAVSHQLTKESVETLEPIREEFPIDISGVRFVGTVMKVSIRGQVYYRGVYATFLNGYIFGLDVKADDTERLQELLTSMIRLQGKDVTAQSSAAKIGRAACGMEMLTATEGVDFDSYLREVYISVKKRWFANMPPSIEKGQKGINAVEFRIMQDGNVAKEFSKMIFGSESDFNAASLQAVREAVPFHHLPEKFSKPFIDVRFTFYYNVAPPKR
jgi:hypothetical protein